MADSIETDVCQAVRIHPEAVNLVAASMTKDKNLADLAEKLKVLSDYTRIRILHALSFSELCVCDLASLLEMSPSAVSHQLRVLRAAKMVRFRKKGKTVFYESEQETIQNILQKGAKILGANCHP